MDLYEEQGSRAVEELGNTGILPEELKGKSAKEVEAAVKEKAEERARLQKKIADVGRQRDTWLNKWKAEQSASGGGKANTLDNAIIQAGGPAGMLRLKKLLFRTSFPILVFP